MNREEAIHEIITDNIVNREFMNFFLGDYLGCGTSRYVFENRRDKKTVIKIDYGNTSANTLEFQTWNRVEKVKSLAKWFAPIKDCSRCGSIIIQAKCDTQKLECYEYPKQIPEIFSDTKYNNFGMLNGKFVCFDYAGHLMFEKGMSLKMKTVKWR